MEHFVSSENSDGALLKIKLSSSPMAETVIPTSGLCLALPAAATAASAAFREV